MLSLRTRLTHKMRPSTPHKSLVLVVKCFCKRLPQARKLSKDWRRGWRNNKKRKKNRELSSYKLQNKEQHNRWPKRRKNAGEWLRRERLRSSGSSRRRLRRRKLKMMKELKRKLKLPLKRRKIFCRIKMPRMIRRSRSDPRLLKLWKKSRKKSLRLFTELRQHQRLLRLRRLRARQPQLQSLLPKSQ